MTRSWTALTQSGRAHLLGLAIVLGAATLIRAVFLLRAPAFITNDSLSYLLPGFDLATGLGFEPIFKRPPLYPAFIGAVLWFFGQQNLLGLMLIQHVLGILTATLSYFLGTGLFGRPAGLLAGLLTALSGPLIVTEHYVMSEPLFCFLLTAALLATVESLRRHSTLGIGAVGLLVGMAALTRPVAQVLIPVIAMLCVLLLPRWRRALCAIGLLVGVYALTVLPWMARNAAVQGSFTLAGGLGEGLAVRTIRLDQDFGFRDPPGGDSRLRAEQRIYREEARKGSAFQLAERLRDEADLTPAQADRAMRDIALGAIMQKPGYYLAESLDMFSRMFGGRPVRLRQDWDPWRGIEWEDRVAHLWPAGAAEEERQFSTSQAVVSLYDPARGPALLAILFGLGCVSAMLTRDRLIVLLPAATALGLLLASAFLVGIEWRYRYPLDPLINVIVAGGVALAAHQASALASRLRLGKRPRVESVRRAGELGQT